MANEQHPSPPGDGTASHRAKRPGFHFGYCVVIGFVLTSFVPVSMGINCAGIFYTPISESISVSTGTLSYFTSVLWLAAVVTLPLLGRLLGRFDARYIVTGACLLVAAGFLWLSGMTALWQFYVGAFAIGIGVCLLLFLAPSTVINRWFAKRAGFYIGLAMAFTGAGSMVFTALGGVLIETVGWNSTYLVFAVLTALTALSSWFLVSDRPERKGLLPHGLDETGTTADELTEEQIRSAEGMSAREAYRTRTFVLLIVLAFLLNFNMYAYFVIPSYGALLPIAASIPLLGATASSVTMAGQTISKLSLGAIGERSPFGGAAGGVALGILGLGVLAISGGSALLFYTGSLFFGFYYGVTNVMMPILTEKAFGNREYPQIYSRISMGATIGAAISGFVWGTLSDMTGTFMSVFAGTALLLAIAICVVALLKRESGRNARRQENESVD